LTFAPPSLLALQDLWTSQGGVSLGIVGDLAHQAKGSSYHLGRDDLKPDAYSARLARDVAGLTNAASAIDFGALDGSLQNLQAFSRWFVTQLQAGAPGTGDIREFIYSPDGVAVRRWDAVTRQIYVGGDGTGQGDWSHRGHSHTSFFRDSEFRDRTIAFRPYFVEDGMEIVSFERWRVAAGTSVYEHPSTAAPIVTRFSVDSDVTAVGIPLDRTREGGKDFTWRKILLRTGAITGTIAWKLAYIRRPAGNPIATEDAWDAALYVALTNPAFRGERVVTVDLSAEQAKEKYNAGVVAAGTKAMEAKQP
jgi:hypothetical protein